MSEQISPKELEHYKIVLNAWVLSRLEKDKAILTLSSAGIGLLVTLITKFGVKSQCELLLYTFGILIFIVAAGCIVAIFHFNANHLKKVVKEEESESPFLQFLDKAAATLFILGLVNLFAIGLLSATNSYFTSKEVVMSEKKGGQTFGMNESFDGIADLKPDKPEKNPSPNIAENDTSNDVDSVGGKK
jgi:hypothetical protein